jgi:hypothetical protein
MAGWIPDEALVVRGGGCLPENFAKGTSVAMDTEGKLQNVSVNSAAGLSLEALTAGNPRTGYPGVRNRQVGVTTAGAVRAAGGEVEPSATRTNPNHATLSGLTPEQASDLFRPTVNNPNFRKS